MIPFLLQHYGHTLSTTIDAVIHRQLGVQETCFIMLMNVWSINILKICFCFHCSGKNFSSLFLSLSHCALSNTHTLKPMYRYMYREYIFWNILIMKSKKIQNVREYGFFFWNFLLRISINLNQSTETDRANSFQLLTSSYWCSDNIKLLVPLCAQFISRFE